MRLPLWPTVLSVVALVVLVGLGTWQLQRLDWKNDLVARVNARIELAAEPLPDPATWSSLDTDALEYRPFVASGVFDHGAEIHVFTSLPDAKGEHGGPGYWVLTPLRMEGGGTVLVNRGFVPEAFKSPRSRAAGLTEGPVRIEGLLRRSRSPAVFQPEPNLAKNIWFARDVPAMAAWRGLQEPAPFFLDARASPPGGLPQGGETRVVFRNTHLEYAITWYGLALALIAVYLAYLRALGSSEADRTIA